MHVEAVYIISYLSAFKNKCRHTQVALCAPELVTRYYILKKVFCPTFIVCRLFSLKSAKHESYFRYACNGAFRGTVKNNNKKNMLLDRNFLGNVSFESLIKFYD